MAKFNYCLTRLLFFILAIFSEPSVASVENSVTLKLSFDKYSVPYTTFIIDGQPIYAMVDTGSAMGFHLYDSQINKIKRLKKESTYSSTDLAGKNQENIKYLADSLDVNHIKLKNVTIAPFKQWGLIISNQGKLPDVPVAGLGVFKDKRITLDYVSNLLTITDSFIGDTKTPKGFTALPFHISPDGLVFDVGQSGHKYRMILDTGATVSMIWRERLKSCAPASCLVVHPEMDNKGCEATMLTVKSIAGKPERFGAVIVDGHFQHMGEVDGLIGNSFLRNRKIIIDFKNKKVFVSDEHRKR
ncbi:hypothetical protein ID858_04655 [Xenorhabdus sp. DI]|uniref:hypothetical protein n=1 Tax=Xenorhabdus doucetiae TaxID=351671 RepID=UPI00199B508B|nr:MULTISPECIES: hypothetical protein [unclassified Xenorhabdus]MBD2784080.1 hypothetical protein [Xenorhabdus sp. 3]MBD2787795.1 hypothetical protein [Xenorhabdus sp. DI]